MAPISVWSARAEAPLRRNRGNTTARRAMPPLNGPDTTRMPVLSLAFSSDGDDMRGASNLSQIDEVLERGAAACDYGRTKDHENALLRGARPILCSAGSSVEAAQGAGALAIVTERKELRSVNLHCMQHTVRQALKFDGCNIFDPARASAAGFEHSGIGRP